MIRRSLSILCVVLAVAALGAAASADYGNPAATGPLRSPMIFPVLGGVPFTDTFGAPRSGGTRLHEGQDLMAPKMTPLVAAVDGTITRLTIPEASYGYALVITDDEGWSYHYLHINNDTPGTDDGAAPLDDVFAPGLRVGSRVRAGQHVAYVGDSGNAENVGPHLHFELHDPTGAAVNAYASLQAATVITTPLPALGDIPELPRIYGVDRIGTAIAASRSAWSSSADVVLASGQQYAEALAASVLAAQRNAPLLLTDPTGVPPRVLDEISRLGASRVAVVGAVGPAADTALGGRGLTVERITGPTPVDTAAMLARRIGAAGGTAVVVNGDRFADGISAAGLAAGRGWPILLASRDALPSATSDALRALGVRRTFLVGGTDVLAEPVAGALPGAVRLAGWDRYDTSVHVADEVLAAGDRSLGRTYLTTGAAFPDALTGGALAARTRGVLLLVDGTGAGADDETRRFLDAHAGAVELQAVLGGLSAVGPAATIALAPYFGG